MPAGVAGYRCGCRLGARQRGCLPSSGKPGEMLGNAGAGSACGNTTALGLVAEVTDGSNRRRAIANRFCEQLIVQNA